MSGLLEDIQPAYPQQLDYAKPVALVPGITETKIRIPVTTALPKTLQPSTEIRVEIPELANCFLDPSSTRVTFNLTLKGKFKNEDPFNKPANAGTDLLDHLPHMYPVDPKKDGSTPAYILGDGHNVFNRYSVWLNGNVLTDDIHNPGMLSYYYHNMKNGIDEQNGKWYQGGLTKNLQDKGTSIGTVILNAPERNLCINQGQEFGGGLTNSSNYLIRYKADGTIADEFDAPEETDTWSFTTNISMNLMGLMGEQNDKMIPMFVGPIRLVFYSNSVENLFCKGGTNMDATEISITNFEFVGNYLRLAQAPLMNVLQQLPDGVFVMKTQSFAYSNIPTSIGQAYQNDFSINTRRASNKMFLITWQPGQSQDGANIGCIEGNLGSVNPNLTFFTGLLINGETYPKQGLDPLYKPMDAFADNMQCFGSSTSAFNFDSWCVSLHDYSNVTDNTASRLWRPYKSFFKVVGGKKLGIDLGGGVGGYDANTQAVYERFRRLLRVNRGDEREAPSFHGMSIAAINANGVVQSDLARKTDDDVLAHMVKVTEGEDENDRGLIVHPDDFHALVLSLSSRLSNPIRRNLLCNFHLAIDTETGKGRYLSGVSTYSGSTVLRANFDKPLTITGTFHIFSVHDALLAFDPSRKTVAWKI
jgi:hypothetical protein